MNVFATRRVVMFLNSYRRGVRAAALMPGILTEERRFEEESGGIAHRNLKPANVFLLAGAPVKILDFSLARSVLPDDHGAIHT